MENKVVIKVNGKELNLKDFPRRVAYNVVLGFIRSLNLEEEPEYIEIHIHVSGKNRGDS
ncbi:hypothetical protein Thal_0129 [Thermocrinis albus DSM 14484]|uniref:Uncharacterized protein n=1 Tax=Thermocrinis albus (strain DSM 14484 / JCM 11386 / HI 11/12) TaxID=638303 RepID=D3SNM9_THEAH|nr:hypothetical protein [Thermocrinis albus]ADC88766.1 hypothetical protein Thal_0129 [Thermocrinis albus DSM 14484]